MKKLAAVIFLAAAFSGCKCVQADYVDSDDATRGSIAPEYKAYVEADAKLDADQKARRLRLLDSWEKRIRDARAALK